MKSLEHLFENNQHWARDIEAANPGFFARLAEQQTPEYLWVGCADSRVPANEIVGLMPGELFVHRNVANLVMHTDLNCLSVIQYAVDVLQVKHVIVCGHYGCGGVKAAMEGSQNGLIDNWLRDIKCTYNKYRQDVDQLPEAERVDRLCEINVTEQVQKLCDTTILQQAWARGQKVDVHGWIYGIKDGLLKDLGVTVSGG